MPSALSARITPGRNWSKTRNPRKTSTVELLSLLLHSCASRTDGFASSPRQICPPSPELSSMRSTLTPLSAALVAAAMPAGPPPTTTMSQLCLFIGADLHSRFAQRLTALYMRNAVHSDATLETDSHTTSRASLLARHRAPKRDMSSDEDGCCHRASGGHG